MFTLPLTFTSDFVTRKLFITHNNLHDVCFTSTLFRERAQFIEQPIPDNSAYVTTIGWVTNRAEPPSYVFLVTATVKT